jgi:hypothetical protein
MRGWVRHWKEVSQTAAKPMTSPVVGGSSSSWNTHRTRSSAAVKRHTHEHGLISLGIVTGDRAHARPATIDTRPRSGFQ